MQIIFGAFVSGLDAGKIYQTWPMMGSSFLPNDLVMSNYKVFFDFENHSLVQFYHRVLAYIIVLYVLTLAVYIFKNKLQILYLPLKILLFFYFYKLY